MAATTRILNAANNKRLYEENYSKPYNQAVQAGKFLFVSGQLAIDPKDGKLVATDTVLQTNQVRENIKNHFASSRL